MINNAKQICPNSFRKSTFVYKANISNNRERWIMMKIFVGGKTTISSSPTNTKGRHFSKNHCTKQGEESKTAFSRFHILNNRCVWFLSSLPKGQRSINKSNIYLLKSNTTGLSMLSRKNTSMAGCKIHSKVKIKDDVLHPVVLKSFLTKIWLKPNLFSN